MKNQNRENGFTLLELLVVISIISILSALAIPSFLNLFDPLRTAASVVDGKLNQVWAMAKQDRERIYCIAPKTDSSGNQSKTQVVGYSGIFNPLNFNPLTDDISDKREEPILSFDLPKGVEIKSFNSGSGDYLYLYGCSESQAMGLPQHRSSGGNFSFAGTRNTNNIPTYAIIQNDRKEIGIVTNSSGQSKIVSRPRTP